MVAGIESRPDGSCVGRLPTGALLLPGKAVKNSLAIRASVAGSGKPAANSSGPPGGAIPFAVLSGASISWPGSLVVIVLSDLDVIEYGNRVIRQNRSRAVE